MKKPVVVLILLLTIALSGCQGAKAPEQNNFPATRYQFGIPVEVDNIIFTITGCTISSVKDDRTSDYEEIEFSVNVENKSDKAINFSEVGWEAQMPDGYKFEQITVDGKIGGQIPSNYKADGTVVIIKEEAIQVKQLLLTYNLMDYNEEWQDAMSEELTEEEYKAKFNPQLVTFELRL